MWLLLADKRGPARLSNVHVRRLVVRHSPVRLERL